jgi:hypothetical protein
MSWRWRSREYRLAVIFQPNRLVMSDFKGGGQIAVRFAYAQNWVFDNRQENTARLAQSIIATR